MISKPLMTIDNFTGMYSGSQVNWMEGLTATKNGLVERYRVYPVVDYNDYGGYTSPGYFDKINSIIQIIPLDKSSLSKIGPAYNLMIVGGSLFYSDLYDNKRKIVRFSFSGDFAPCNNGDIIGTTDNNILWTSARHLIRGIRGINKTENTNKIIDKDGRNFSTLGVQNGDKIINIITGVQYTITSITTTTSTNDTLNFVEEAGKTNKDKDEFIVFIPQAYDLIGRDYGDPRQYPGQLRSSYWNRPIRASYEIGGGGYLIGNGNYLAFLSSDENNFDKHFKQLPFGHQLISFEIGKQGDVLASSHDKNGIGHLLYWDGFSDNWNEVTPINSIINALHPYKNGWVYFVNSVLFFTNGRDVEMIGSLEKNKTLFNTNSFNAINSIEDDIYIASGKYVFIFNNFGFTTVRLFRKNGFKATPYCVSAYNENLGAKFENNYVIMVGGDGVVCEIINFSANNNPKAYNKVLFKIDLKQETKISEVWLNVQQADYIGFQERGRKHKTKIEVNISNGSLKPMNYLQAKKSIGKDVIEMANYKGVINAGYEVFDQYGLDIEESSGERFFIKSITDEGTANEKWEIEPELYDSRDNYFNITSLGIYKGEKKDVYNKDFNKPIRFTDINFLGSTLWLEIAIQGDSDSIPINIQSIQLF